MSEASVRAIRLPQVRTDDLRNSVAKKALTRLFQHIQVGTLTLHEGGDSRSYGRPYRPGEPHAEVRVHNPDVYLPYGDGGFRVVVKVADAPNQDTLLVRSFGVSGHIDQGAKRLLEVAVEPGS